MQKLQNSSLDPKLKLATAGSPRKISRLLTGGFMFLGLIIVFTAAVSWFGLRNFQRSMISLAETTLPNIINTAESAVGINSLQVAMERFSQVNSAPEYRIALKDLEERYQKFSNVILRRDYDLAWKAAQLNIFKTQISRLEKVMDERLKIESHMGDVVKKINALAEEIIATHDSILKAKKGEVEVKKDRFKKLISLLLKFQNKELVNNAGTSRVIILQMQQGIHELKLLESNTLETNVEWNNILQRTETLFLGTDSYSEYLVKRVRLQGEIDSVTNTTRSMMNQLAAKQLSLFVEYSSSSNKIVSDAYANLVIFSLFFVVATVITLILSVVAYFYFKRAFVTRIEKLNVAVLAKVAGEENKIDTSGNDEIATIAKSVDYFAVEMNRSMQIAEASSKAKSEFLSNMSHEIRTPLNAILGFARMLGETSLAIEQSKFVEKINISAKFLLDIINNTLDFSKIEAGKLTVEKIPFKFRDTLTSVAVLVESRATTKGLNFTMDIDENIPDLVEGDPLRTFQILNNLSENAVKFTRKGTIAIKAEALEEDSKTIWIRFAVKDDGIGLLPEQVNSLFNPFTQADSSTTRHFGGTGLGLSICKSLCELLGGEISVESEYGKGSTFLFKLPYKKIDQDIVLENEESSGVPDFSGKNVLLVEDNIINQEIALAILEKTKANIDVVMNGLKAVEAVQSKAYDLVLMDIQMPVMDGITATKKIMELPDYSAKLIPIIAMTAHAMDSDRQKSTEAGMVGHITKPIEPEILYDIIKRWIG